MKGYTVTFDTSLVYVLRALWWTDYDRDLAGRRRRYSCSRSEWPTSFTSRRDV